MQKAWVGAPRDCLVCIRQNKPGRVFDLKLPLEKMAEGYKAMDERRAIKTMLLT